MSISGPGIFQRQPEIQTDSASKRVTDIMNDSPNTDYATFREIVDELLRPISGEDLDGDTLKRLYESKLVYLENLRIKCFKAVNTPKGPTPQNHFTVDDYSLIVSAITDTRRHLKQSMMLAISGNISRRKVI